MTLLLLCFLIGVIASLRAFTAPAAVCWGTLLGWLSFGCTRLRFIDHAETAVLVTLFACTEIVIDRLLYSRTSISQLLPRILFGGCSGAALATGTCANAALGAALGVAGALCGTFAGHGIRHALVVRRRISDLPVTLVQDLIAIGGGLLIVSRR